MGGDGVQEMSAGDVKRACIDLGYLGLLRHGVCTKRNLDFLPHRSASIKLAWCSFRQYGTWGCRLQTGLLAHSLLKTGTLLMLFQGYAINWPHHSFTHNTQQIGLLQRRH